jgi:hypothetical protein
MVPTSQPSMKISTCSLHTFWFSRKRRFVERGPNSSRVKPFAKDTPNLHEGQQSTSD